MALTFAAIPFDTASAVRFGDVAGLPRGYWAVRAPYDEALSANNSTGITTHGENIINFWLQDRTAGQAAAVFLADVQGYGWEINELWSVTNKVAEEYQARGDIQNAIRIYRMALAFVDPYKALIPSIGGDPDDMEFSRIYLQNWLAAWDVTVELYAEIESSSGSGDTSFRGALHEPRTGIFYGEPPGNSAMMSFDKKPSGTLIYVEYETESLPERVEHDLLINESRHGYNRQDYSIIEIAWNFRYEGSTLRSVPGDRTKVVEAARYLNSLGLPILLRVGAEMNVWENAADPEAYKTAFRFVANIMHENAPNVAMVWSVNSVSSAGLTYEMFYPGAEYVDWVGISLYVGKYFRGNPNTTDSEAAIWGSGRYSNPVRFVADLVRLYGARHPIMIAEGGVTLYNRPNNENLTAWALPWMRVMYTYIPMLFPEVKAIFWFNVDFPGVSGYNFSASPQAADLYRQLTSSGYFLGKGQTSAGITYAKIGTATLPANAVTLLTFAPLYTLSNLSVQYYVDGTQMGQSTDVPYRLSLDLSGHSNGAHSLQIRVLSGGVVQKTEDYYLYKNGAEVIVSNSPIAGPPAPPPNPIDTAAEWARALILSAILKGFVPEDLQDNYSDVITREEFCRMAVNWIEYALGKSIDAVLADNGVSRNPNAFSDTTNPDILAAFALRILSGVVAPTETAPGRFNPNGDFTRQEAAVMITNTCRAIGVDVDNPPTSDFADLNTADVWARSGINFARAKGIMSGVTSTPPLLFEPHTTFTRQESILLFNNIDPATLLS